MSLKKKLGMAIMTGALGVGLIGGGTWAAFNDVETINNTFAAGTLDLEIGDNSSIEMSISNLKPGDYFTRDLVLENNGSLHINQIFVRGSTVSGVWEDKDVLDLNTRIVAGAGDNSEQDFLAQFAVEVTPDGGTPIAIGTLADLASGVEAEITGTSILVPGLPVGGSLAYEIKVTFVEDPARFTDSRLHVQNKYQGEQSKLNFIFEATQMPGSPR